MALLQRIIKSTDSREQSQSRLFEPPTWLDYCHNGYQVTSFDQYLKKLKPWLDCVQRTIVQAHSMLIWFLRGGLRMFELLGSVVPAMACFIALIGEAIVNGTTAFPPELSRPSHSWSMIWTPSLKKTMVEEIIAHGWCPSILHYLIATTSVSALEFANPETYVPSHTSGCEALAISGTVHCEYIAPSFTEVEQMIPDDGIPVITLYDESGENMTLAVHRLSETKYVALSHVWADGLGSTTEKGLPACQLRRMSSLVARISPGAAFWVESLCIPSADNAREKAIGMMAATYSDAVAVLVLDKGLQLCHSIDPPGLKLLRVLTSGWMRRLWTLQEAVLAKELHFNFANRIVALGELIPSTSIMLLHAHLDDFASKLFQMSKKSIYRSYSLTDVTKSIRWRTSSRLSDETLAIASLLGSKPSELIEIKSPEGRMMMLQDVRRIPKNILLLTGEKLKAPGFRWAPASFMATAGSMLDTMNADITLMDDGLQSAYFAMLFPKTGFASGTPWYMKDERGRTYQIGDTQPEGVGDYTCDMLLALDTVPHGSSGACVGVLRTGHHANSDRNFTVHCEYVRRLVCSNVSKPKHSSAENMIHSNLSGKLSVCVS
ncbi:hypothetical protein PT974_00969 [Cladobotryum mycophilum]|uniref:Heterokaryon incompatibility domain-containing protein n=1 Tax=Cladobotryum mycophilum TaxID=491253 RepID=A0ABR0T2C6_9HYPO